MTLQGATSRCTGTAASLGEAREVKLPRGIYHAHPPGQTIVDTNRARTSKLPALIRLFPEARVICRVRALGWVMTSVERLTRADLSGLFGYDASDTIYMRVMRMASSEGLAAYALHEG